MGEYIDQAIKILNDVLLLNDLGMIHPHEGVEERVRINNE